MLRIIPETTQRVIDSLSLRLPVKVRFADPLDFVRDHPYAGFGEVMGDSHWKYDLFGAPREHIIRLNRTLPAPRLTETLLHELRHAWQREHLHFNVGADVDATFRASTAELGYFHSPQEIDARRYATETLDSVQLVEEV